MSSVLIIQQYDNLYMGADTAISTTIDGQIFRVGEEGKKIFIIGNQLIFCSGNLNISYAIMDIYEKSRNYNVNVLQRICKSISKNIDKDYMIEIMIARYNTQDDKVDLYQVSSYNNFNIIEKNVGKDDTAILTGGIKTEECFDISLNYLNKNPEINYIYQNTFNDISYEGIGGNLLVYQINKNDIKQVIQSKIKEKQNIRYINNLYISKKHLLVGKALYGKVIGSNKLIITNMNDKGESSFLVDGEHMKAINMDLSLENKTQLNRLYLNPDVGIKIQKRSTKGDQWKDALYLDNSGEIFAKSFHVINTNSVLDDTGLKIYNGKLSLYNENGDNVFNVNSSGESDAFGRFRVFRYDGDNKITLADMYKDNNKGGKLLLNDWNGSVNAFLGSPPDSTYTGGFFKLYNGSTSKERIEIGTYSSNDMGVINIKNNNSTNIVEINGNDGGGTINLKNASEQTQIHISSMDDTGANQGVVQLYGDDNNVKLTLKGKSNTDNMSESVSGDRKTGGLIQFTSYDNRENYFMTVNNENNFGMYDMNNSAFEINKLSGVIINHQNKSNINLFDGGINFLVDDRSKFRVAQGKIDTDTGTIQNGIDFGIPCMICASSASFNGLAGTRIPFAKDLGNTNYVVNIAPNANSSGYVGEYWYVKSTNGFTVYNSGSAVTGFDYMALAY